MSAAEHAAVTNTLLAVEEGDEIRLAARHYEWTNPLDVVTVQEIQWRAAAGENWRSRTLTVDTGRSTHWFDVVDGLGVTDWSARSHHGPVESVERVTDGPEPLAEPTDPESDWWACPPVATRIDDTEAFSRLGADEEDTDDTDGYPHTHESKADLASDIREHAGQDPEPDRSSLNKADLIQVGLRCGLPESIIGYPGRTILAEVADELEVAVDAQRTTLTRDDLETLRDAFLEQVDAPDTDDDFRRLMADGGVVMASDPPEQCPRCEREIDRTHRYRCPECGTDLVGDRDGGVSQ